MKNFVHANALKLEEIGERIRLRRKKLKYTLEDIEKATGISRKTLIKLEKGGGCPLFYTDNSSQHFRFDIGLVRSN